MHFLNHTLPGLADNLALDEALLLHGEAGGPEVLRLWEWPSHAVVLGAGGRVGDDVDEAACLADGVPIARRSSGGGTVLLGPGCLLFSLILRFDRAAALTDLHASYRFVLGRIQSALEPHLGPISLQGTSDLAVGERKFSGNAQQRKRTHLLHHGTFLCGFELESMRRYLKPPPRQPEYRRGRDHVDFLTNVPIHASEFERRMREAWDARSDLVDWPIQRVADLVREKYERIAWIRRR